MKVIGRREAVSGVGARLERDPVNIVEVSDKELALLRELSEEGGIDQLRGWAKNLADDLAERLGMRLVPREGV